MEKELESISNLSLYSLAQHPPEDTDFSSEDIEAEIVRRWKDNLTAL